MCTSIRIQTMRERGFFGGEILKIFESDCSERSEHLLIRESLITSLSFSTCRSTIDCAVQKLQIFQRTFGKAMCLAPFASRNRPQLSLFMPRFAPPRNTHEILTNQVRARQRADNTSYLVLRRNPKNSLNVCLHLVVDRTNGVFSG